MSTSTLSVIEKILDLARWAPSGDNTQPWRFEITSESTVVVRGYDTREHCVYDFEGHPSQMSLGALLETLTIAATGFQLRAEITRQRGQPDDKPSFDVRLIPDPAVGSSPLIPFITARTVQRRAMRTSPLTQAQKAALEAAVGNGYKVVWWENAVDRAHIAMLLFRSARIRLTMPEAYQVHRDVIEFGARFSEDRIPDEALGLNPLAIRTMRWMMASWSRVEFFNRYCGGTLVPRIELDLIPGFACAAHFSIVPANAASSTDDFVAGGAALQRFWLTASREQLFMQPEMTPLIFGWYARAGKRFSTVTSLWDQALTLTRQWGHFIGDDVARRAVFFGRIGNARPPSSRSLRLPLAILTEKR